MTEGAGQGGDTGHDETAAIDLGVAFFCAVLVLFVFVAFNLDDDPRPDVPQTLGQREQTRPLAPPAWSPVAERGSLAVFHAGRLTVLDLAEISAGLADPTRAYSGDDGFTLAQMRAEPSPAAFALRLSMAVPAIPAPWRRETRDPGPETPCPETARPLVTVLAPPEAGDLAQLEAYARRCGHRLRIEPVPERGGMLQIPLGLSSADFAAEGMFR